MTLRPMAALAVIFLFACAAHAGTAEELTAAINKCAAIADDATRHACYDRLPKLLKSAPAPVAEATPPAAPPPAAPSPAATPPAAPPPAVTPPGPIAEKESSSGFLDLFDGEPVPADHITATVQSLTFDYGLFVVTLDNGQVWRQVAAAGDLVHFSRDKQDQITIWRNRFGEYVLKITGYHTTYHVRRVK